MYQWLKGQFEFEFSLNDLTCQGSASSKVDYYALNSALLLTSMLFPIQRLTQSVSRASISKLRAQDRNYLTPNYVPRTPNRKSPASATDFQVP